MKKDFNLPPISPLIGSDFRNYVRVTNGNKVESKFILKYLLTGLIIFILTPFRWYERWVFRKARITRLKQPIFILGHWRSGTTHLHNILCQSPQAAYVSTYQTVFTQYLASAGIMKPFMRLMMPEKRPSDNVKLNVAYPQEEEFALNNSTFTSYYLFFYFPKKSKEYFNRYVLFSSEKDKHQWSKSYIYLLQKAKYIMPKSNFLVVKNPVNTGRHAVLKEIYPDARFLHIYRNPYTVFLSTKKFFLNLMPTLWFHSLSELEIEELILDNYINFMDQYYSSDGIENVYEIKFEDFERNNLEQIQEIYRNLGIDDFEGDKLHFEAYISKQKSYQKNQYSISKREVELIKNRWGAYLKKWNYDLPSNMQIVD